MISSKDSTYSTYGKPMGKPDKNILWELIYGTKIVLKKAGGK